MNEAKWGIIGTGRIAHTFAAALRETEGALLCAAASRSIGKAQEFAEEFGFATAYGSYAELAADPDIDAVYIATPMASHFGDAMLCLNAGKNVLCEKSVALNSRQLAQILRTAEEKQLFFMEAMWTKCRPAYIKAKEWAASGKIGDIRYVKADFSNTVVFDGNDRLFRPDCGGGALLDLAVYPLTLAADFLGNSPAEIISSAHIRDGIDLSNTILLKYPSGAFASADSGFELSLKNNAVISGNDGMIVFDDWFFCSGGVTLYGRDNRPIERFTEPESISGYTYEIQEFQRCLRSGINDSPLVPHEGTLAVMQIMDECRKQWGLTFPDE